MRYKNRFGEVFHGYNFDSYGYLYNGNFLLRRLLYALALVFLDVMCVSQIAVLIIGSYILVVFAIT